MKTVMFYEVTADSLAGAKANFEGHRARLREFHERGVLLMAGPPGSPPEGAMGVFTDRKAAEEFIRGDPFVLNGLVTAWRLVDWNEVLA